MTNNEKVERLHALSEQMLALQGVMSASDAHALKCKKLDLDFKETYPEDYAAYVKAREDYNEAEKEYAEVEATPTEDEPVEAEA